MLPLHVDERSCKYEHDLVTWGQSTIVQPQRLRHVDGNRRGCNRRLRPCRLRPVVPRVDLERHQLNCPVPAQLTDDGVRTHEHSRRDQDAVVAPPKNELGQIIEARREAFDDLQQLKRLEVVCRRLAVRSTFTVELAIKVLEELKRRADLATFTAHPR